MGRDESVAAGVAAVQQGEVDVLTGALQKCFDDGESQGTGPGFTQADIDAAVAAATGPLNDQVAALQTQDAADIKAGQDAVTAAQAITADLQTQFDALNIKEKGQEDALAAFGAKYADLQAALKAIGDLLNPPAPAPAPGDGSQPQASAKKK